MFKAAAAAIKGNFSIALKKQKAFRFLIGAFDNDGKITRKRWSRDEEIYLARSYPKGTDVGFIAGLIGRPVSAVRRKAIRLGVHRPRSGRAAKAAPPRRRGGGAAGAAGG
ncbi:hypothetical protein, partial [Acetobacter syzygii]|uniref:hypothetical protein n=1 Tax=Acetobacter syzygii TaxID=146476 RepID=UPI0039EA380E